MNSFLSDFAKNFLGSAVLLPILMTVSLMSCETVGEKEPPTAPNITHDLPLKEAISAGVQFGGQTMTDVKRLITRRNEWPAAVKILESKIPAMMSTLENGQLVNAAHFYQAAPVSANPDLFKSLVGSARPLARDMGWQIAATMPSKAIAAAIDRELSRAVANDDEKAVLVPLMAEAVKANRLASSYTLLREGLMETGHESFAEAMADLQPAIASNDFMDYLAKAPVEELRQMTLKSVNLYSCMVSLRHMLTRPVSLAHPNAEYLFLYSVSRNSGLSDMANAVIENNYIVNQRPQFALILARMPVWVQLAYVENARRRQVPAVAVFLNELKKVASQQEVIEEIDEYRR